MNTLSAIWPMVMSTTAPVQPEHRRQDGDEEPGIDAEEEHLEDGVEGHQPGAVFGVSPASSFQTITMAMQRARPMMIRPTMYSGISAQEEHGQTRTSASGRSPSSAPATAPSTFLFRKTRPSSSYFTLASGGYIIRIRPMAMGMLVVPTFKALMTPVEAGDEVARAPRRRPWPGRSRASGSGRGRRGAWRPSCLSSSSGSDEDCRNGRPTRFTHGSNSLHPISHPLAVGHDSVLHAVDRVKAPPTIRLSRVPHHDCAAFLSGDPPEQRLTLWPRSVSRAEVGSSARMA